MDPQNDQELVYGSIFELCREHGLAPICAVMLGHDGSMTRLLELAIAGPVSLQTIRQRVVACPREAALHLDVKEGEEVNERDILMVHALNGQPLLHARSYTPLARLRPGFREDMMRADIPIGKIMRAHKIEARREILEVGYLENDQTLRSLLQTQGPYIWRRYNIITTGRPLITIRESLAVSRFREGSEAVKT